MLYNMEREKKIRFKGQSTQQLKSRSYPHKHSVVELS